MNTLIRIIGCVVLTCALMACPVCLAIILAFHKVVSMPLVTMLLIALCLVEFYEIFAHLYEGSEKE